MKVGVQLFSLRDIIKDEKTIDETLSKLKEIGYDCIESAGSDNFEYISNKSQELGLELISAHLALEWIEENTELLASGKFPFLKYAIVPSMDEKDRSFKHYADTVKRINNVRNKLATNNIEVLYHNHDFEFKMLEGDNKDGLVKSTAHQFFTECRDEKGLLPIDIKRDLGEYRFEYDTFWLYESKIKVAEFLQDPKNKRANILHFKEWNKANDEGERYDGVIGQGKIEFDKIINMMSNEDTIIVEQETTINNDIIGDLAQSYQKIRALVEAK